jgi:hypothetical protein
MLLLRREIGLLPIPLRFLKFCINTFQANSIAHIFRRQHRDTRIDSERIRVVPAGARIEGVDKPYRPQRFRVTLADRAQERSCNPPARRGQPAGGGASTERRRRVASASRNGEYRNMIRAGLPAACSIDSTLGGSFDRSVLQGKTRDEAPLFEQIKVRVRTDQS